MKRWISIVATAGIIVTSLGTPAFAIPDDRTVTKTYSMTAGFVSGSTEGSVSAGTNWAIFKPRAKERFVSLSIEDATGGPVLGRVEIWDMRTASWSDRGSFFCTETQRPLRIKAYEKLYVGAYLGSCPDGSFSLVTTGTITATFSR